MIDRVVGNTYRILEKIGEGGMGAVYRAEDVMLERQVAIKAIRPELASEPEIVERFRTEARILARVSHPAIATIYSFFRDGDDLFLAMELVHGRSLSKVLESEGRLPWERAAGLLATALPGIEEAHRAGIVHRDLKPDNLMLTGAGTLKTLKVMDFGISRVTGSGHLTRTGLLVGTLRYIAPEQIRGEEVDPRTDIYALGAVLFEMLAGRPAFEGKTDYAILQAQLDKQPEPPSALAPDVPAWLDRVVLRALAKSPAERFQSAGELQAALTARGPAAEATRATRRTESIEDLPTIVTPPTRARELATQPIAPAAAAPILAGTAVPAPGSYRPIPSEASSGSWKLMLAAAAVLAVLAGAGAGLWQRGSSPETAAPEAAGAQPTPAPAVAALAESTPAPAPAVIEATEARATPAPVRAKPAPLPRATPAPALPQPVPAPEPTPAVEASTPAEPVGGEAVETAPAEELRRLAGEQKTESARLFELYQAWLERKEKEGGEITDADEDLEEHLESLAGSAEKLHGLLQGGGMIARLRRRGDPDARPQLARRLQDLAVRAEKVERLMQETESAADVRQLWAEVRRRGQRMAAILKAQE